MGSVTCLMINYGSHHILLEQCRRDKITSAGFGAAGSTNLGEYLVPITLCVVLYTYLIWFHVTYVERFHVLSDKIFSVMKCCPGILKQRKYDERHRGMQM